MNPFYSTSENLAFLPARTALLGLLLLATTPAQASCFSWQSEITCRLQRESEQRQLQMRLDRIESRQRQLEYNSSPLAPSSYGNSGLWSQY